MLYFNTINLKEVHPASGEDGAAQELVQKLIARYQSGGIAQYLDEVNRALVFDYFMNFNEVVFRSASRALCFDYTQHMENNFASFLDSTEGEEFLQSLRAIDLMWQEVQAPVNELVQAGKSQLINFNGAANYENFQDNAAEKPDLFEPTKKLVDHYLRTELMALLIDHHLHGALELSSCKLCVSTFKTELQEFALMARQFGFWSPPKQSDNPVVRNIAMMDMLACC